MNRTHPSRSRRAARVTLAAAAAALAAASGCAKDRAFTVNGQVVTRDEYIKTLERQNVVAPGGGNTTGIKSAIDTIVGNKIIVAEATKEGVLPTDDVVQRYYRTQKDLFEKMNPGKDYEKSMADEGTTPEDIRDQMKVQLAETAVYAKRLGITDSQVQEEYNRARGGFGLPARVQLRLIIPTSQTELTEAQKALSAKNADFNAVADKINPPQLKATHGLLPQTQPVNGPGIPGDLSGKIQQTAEGAFFGPTDLRLSPDPRAAPVRAWVKVEKKLPGYTIPISDAQEIVRAELVQKKLRDPDSQSVRQQLIQEKLNASFEAAPRYVSVWNGLKTGAAAVFANQAKAPAGAAPTNPLANPGAGAAATTPLTK